MSAPDPPNPTPATTPAATAEIRTMSRVMLRGGLWPAVVVGVVTVVVAAVLRGGAGLAAGLVGAVLAVGVSVLGPLVMRWTSAVEPMLVMGIAMISFVTKFVLLGVLFLVLTRLGVLDGRMLALALGPTAIAFIAGETIASARARTPTVVT